MDNNERAAQGINSTQDALESLENLLKISADMGVNDDVISDAKRKIDGGILTRQEFAAWLQLILNVNLSIVETIMALRNGKVADVNVGTQGSVRDLRILFDQMRLFRDKYLGEQENAITSIKYEVEKLAEKRQQSRGE